jgi:membrane-associated HD superfamily phosphohydrolase
MSVRGRFTVPMEPPVPELPRHIGFHAARWLPMVGLALLMLALYPGAGQLAAPALETGQVALEDVVAPFDFDVRKTSAELAREGDQLEATVIPIYLFQPTGLDTALAVAGQLFTALEDAGSAAELEATALARGLRLSRDEAAFLLEPGKRTAFRTATTDFLRRELARGVTGSGVLQAEPARELVVRRGQTERVVSRDEVGSYQRYLAARSDRHPSPNSSIGDQIYVKILNLVFRPTLQLNRAETDSLRREIRQSVDSVKDVVRTNELIVGEHQVVTPDVHARLDALRAELVARDLAGRSLQAVLG